MPVNAKEWLAFIAVLGVSLFLSLTFYNQSMYGPDDGYYAYIAERINQGALYGRDITGFHPGYIHYLNAFVTSIFGESFLSLRYPLILITLLQSALAFLLFRDKSLKLAVLAALTLSSFSFILFPNPAANWYCTFLIMAGLFIIQKFNIRTQGIVFSIGFIIGLSFMFRHLSGIFIAGGFMMYLVSSLKYDAEQNDTKPTAKDIYLCRAAILALISPFIIYLAFFSRAPDLFALMSFALWPIIFAGFLFFNKYAPPAKLLTKTIALALAGAAAAALPMILFQLANGNLDGWLSSLMEQSLSIPATKIENTFQYSYLLRFPIVFAMEDPSVGRLLNLILFAILPLLTAINGLLLLYFTAMGKRPNAFLILGAFYAYSALYLQIPSYLYYMIAFPILGILSAIWEEQENLPQFTKPITIAITLFICAVTPIYHAGQTVTRTFGEYVGGMNSRGDFAASTNPKIMLDIEKSNQDLYDNIISDIHQNSGEDDVIFTFPFNPEHYYFSERKSLNNATSTLHINSEVKLNQLVREIESYKPKLIIHSVNDKYNTEFTEKFANMIKNNYKMISEHEHHFAKFEIYKYKDSE